MGNIPMSDSSSTSETSKCPKCGVELTSPQSELCPGCLLKAATEEPSSQEQGPDDTEQFPSGSGFTPPEPSDLGEQLPGLQILELIGRGGMGAVYTARQKGLNRVVAVKVLPKEVRNDPGFGDRFVREAQTLAKLNHPNIVTVYDFGRAGDLFYFVMEFVDGITLRESIAAGGVKPEEALRIVPELCEALQYAHEEGVVHRDIKPENILLDRRGRIKIADFGLAKLLKGKEQDQNLTHTHQVMGTMNYMAPEQMTTGKEVDHRADIYSLGVIFYELLTGELPKGWFAPPSKKVAVDVRIDDVVLRALESEPSKRYQHASDVKSDVERLSSDANVRSTSSERTNTGEIRLHKILDETKSSNRRLQQWMLTFGIGLLLGAIYFGVMNSSPIYVSLSLIAVSLVLMRISSMLKRDQIFEAAYKSHTIRLDNTSLWAERLFLDDGLVKRGGFGSKMEFRFPIKAGEGLGDEIVVWFDAGSASCRCRMEVEERL